MENKEYNFEKILRIAGIVLTVIVVCFFIVYLIGSWLNNSIPEPTDAPSLEEIATQEGKELKDLIPEPTDAPSLEEIATQEGKELKDLIPEPTNILPLK